MRQLARLFCLLLLALTWTSAAGAANGDNLRQIIADRSGTDCASVDADGHHNSVGVGVAFDGTNLLLSCYSDNTVTAVSPADGSQIAVHHIVGAGALGALAWDNGRHVLWACSNFSTIGTIDLTTDVFVPLFNTNGCFDGTAYDSSDDSVWTSPDATNHITHYTSTGVNVGEFFPSLPCGNSGIAVGGSLLYLATNGCSSIYTSAKDFSSPPDFFASFPARLEDMECDNITFASQNKAAIWSIDAYDNVLNAWEIPNGSCLFGGGGPGPPATVTVTPPTDTNAAGEQHCVTATVTDSSDAPVPGVTVQFSVTGVNSASGTGTSPTDANGEAMFCYTGTVAGTDTITAYADTNNSGVQDPDEPSGTATKIYTPAAPATLTLTPETDTNPVDAEHCVTATVKDAFGNATPGIIVRFSVTGSVTTGGPRTTDANGQATFCYTGPALPGSDVITAYADTNNNSVQDPGEPSDRATKDWVLPASTPGCKVTDGGRITAANGDKATFGSVAMVSDDATASTSGSQEYQDHGSAANLDVHSTAVLAVVCSGTKATVFGTATINGSGSYDFRVDLTDNGEPGAGADKYRIRLSTGYDSGEQTLAGGNVQQH